MDKVACGYSSLLAFLSDAHANHPHSTVFSAESYM